MLSLHEFHGFAVAYDISLEAIFLPQQFGQEIFRSYHRLPVPVVVAGHDFHRMSLFHDTAEWIQEYLMKLPGSDMRVGPAVRVTTSFRHPVGNIMLQARGHSLALYSFHHLPAKFGYQERILSVAFHHPAPSLVAGHIQDRCIYAVIAQQSGFVAGDPAGLKD